jgi:hypothetical protein
MSGISESSMVRRPVRPGGPSRSPAPNGTGGTPSGGIRPPAGSGRPYRASTTQPNRPVRHRRRPATHHNGKPISAYQG